MVHPNNGRMYNCLAGQMAMSGNMTLVVSLFNHSVHLEPHFITAYTNLALNLYNVNNDTVEAIKVLVKLDHTP